eukprot:scaffold287_cov173-Amphora_coffeaeformis.AAC.28
MRRSLFFSLFFVLRQGQSFVPSTRPWFAIDAPAPASRFRHDQVLRSNGASSSSRTDDVEITDEKLYEIARRLKLEIFDLEEGIFGFDSQDPYFGHLLTFFLTPQSGETPGLEVIQTEIPLSSENPSLGLVLTEMAGNKDGRGLVLVSEVTGNAKNARSSPILVGDVITGVRTSDGSLRERTTGLNYDRTVEAVGDVKEAALKGDGTLHLELNRENLRRLLLRKDIRLYNRKTKRFDMPYATGDCAGEGLCGTCLVAVNEGMDLLNPKDGAEELITRGRPLSWRASCRTVVGSNNEGGTIQVRVQPQSDFEDELNPRVKSVKRKE